MRRVPVAARMGDSSFGTTLATRTAREARFYRAKPDKFASSISKWHARAMFGEFCAKIVGRRATGSVVRQARRRPPSITLVAGSLLGALSIGCPRTSATPVEDSKGSAGTTSGGTRAEGPKDGTSSAKIAPTPDAPEPAANEAAPNGEPIVTAPSIGALLPLTGRGSEVGQMSLRGLVLASQSDTESPRETPTKPLEVRDVASDPERASQGVEQLAANPNVLAIVGPIDAKSAAAAAARAQALQIPLITLTTHRGITKAGSMVFRMFFSPEGEMATLIEGARARGARRFAVLYPENGFGQTLRVAFEKEIAARGLAVVASESYAANATSFGTPVDSLAKRTFDALLIADSASKIALIAPALAAAGMWSSPSLRAPQGGGRSVVILAPSVGFDPRLPAKAGRYLQGALFSTPFYASTARGLARDFVDGFQAQHAASPDLFAAFAFDAYQLVRKAVQSGARTRSELAAALAAMRGVETASPADGFTPDRQPIHETHLVELQGNVFSPVDVPPKGPEPAARLTIPLLGM